MVTRVVGETWNADSSMHLAVEVHSRPFALFAAAPAVEGLMAAIIAAYPGIEGILKNLLIDPQTGAVRAGIPEMLMEKGGQSGVVTTLHLFEVMLRGIEDPVMQAEAVKWLIAHHGPEVFSDALDGGRNSLAYRDAHLAFCYAAMQVLNTGETPEIKFEEFRLPFGHAVLTDLNNLLLEFGIQAQATFDNALRVNLGGNLALKNRVNEIVQQHPELGWLADFIINALWKRYQAQINLTNSGGYSRFDRKDALINRRDSILIMATMGVSALHMLAEDSVGIPQTERRQIREAMELGATLVGILNDIGTHLSFILERGEIISAVEMLRSYANGVSPIEALQRLATEEVRGSSSAEQPNIEYVLKNIFPQLIKDAQGGEWNLVLDGVHAEIAAGQDGWQVLKDGLVKMNRIASNKQSVILRHLQGLLSSSNENVRKLAKMIRDTVEFHAQLYKGGNDYYHAHASGGNLPVVNGGEIIYMERVNNDEV